MKNCKVSTCLTILCLVIIQFSIFNYILIINSLNGDNNKIEIDIQNEATAIKVISFNTQRGTPGGNCKDSERDQKVNSKKAKISALADYLAAQKVDVALLQEMVDNCDQHEADMLSEYLKARNYNMEFATARDSHMNVAIFSKFPINQSGVKLLPISARTVIMAPVQTPFGQVNFYSIHVRAADPDRCPGIKDLYNIFKADTNSKKILGGDFNLTMDLDSSKYTCPQEIRRAFTAENKFVGGGIDFIVNPNNEILKIDSSLVDQNSPDSDHKAIIAVISSTLQPTPIPSPSNIPTPIVSVSPIPSVPANSYPIDLDEDGKVGINDFMKFVEYYKTSSCKIDFNKNNNCKDIGDFQIFVREYKASNI
ncbi:endonuclease/exonuclease/phosphatase family protein [Candidatus Dojkabacteria bacterium]|nr:endonuclease/exonuclease/phosphatase family protein [Candidatus Dojkabacteria bacterium]